MEKLKIAIQKKGRLNEKTMKLIEEAGIKINSGSGKLVSTASNFPIEILYLRDDDIPQSVAVGVADAGIVGENEVAEKNVHVEIVERLGFAGCRMSLALPKSMDYKGPAWFNNKKIATSYPVILQKWLDANSFTSQIIEISGSVEIAPGIGMSDAIFDIVSTGSTLISNGLREVETIMTSEAVFISRNLSPQKQEILNKLLFRFRAVQKAKNSKYILLNAPNEAIPTICEILPGVKSPTVLPLAEKGWSSLHSVVDENEFWEVIDRLKEAGAQGILVVPIGKMIV